MVWLHTNPRVCVNLLSLIGFEQVRRILYVPSKIRGQHWKWRGPRVCFGSEIPTHRVLLDCRPGGRSSSIESVRAVQMGAGVEACSCAFLHFKVGPWRKEHRGGKSASAGRHVQTCSLRRHGAVHHSLLGSNARGVCSASPLARWESRAAHVIADSGTRLAFGSGLFDCLHSSGRCLAHWPPARDTRSRKPSL